ncbi:MAG: hypothetical protein IJH36_04065 [Clostridia bacterium]|nr:hypothetical protein [Clostridia bacterium]
MKSKKLISFLCALAMTVSSFAGLAVTASAATTDDILWSDTFNSYDLSGISYGTWLNNKLVSGEGSGSKTYSGIDGIVLYTGTKPEGDDSTYWALGSDTEGDNYLVTSTGRFTTVNRGAKMLFGSLDDDDNLVATEFAATTEKDVVLNLKVKGKAAWESANTYDNAFTIVGKDGTNEVETLFDMTTLGLDLDTWYNVKAVVTTAGTSIYVNNGTEPVATSTAKSITGLKFSVYINGAQGASGQEYRNSGNAEAGTVAGNGMGYPSYNLDDIVVFNADAGTGATTEVPAAQTHGAAVVTYETVPAGEAPSGLGLVASDDFNSMNSARLVFINTTEADSTYTDLDSVDIFCGTDSSTHSETKWSVTQNAKTDPSLGTEKYLEAASNVKSAANRGPKFYFKRDGAILEVAEREKVVAQFAAKLHNNGDQPAEILFSGDLVASESKGNINSPLALITTDADAASAAYSCDNPLTKNGDNVIEVANNTWVLVEIEAYRSEGKTTGAKIKVTTYTDGEANDPVYILGSASSYGDIKDSTKSGVNNLPYVSFRSGNSTDYYGDGSGSNTTNDIDNIAIYSSTVDPAATPTPTPVPKHDVEITNDGQNVTIESQDDATTKFDGVLIHVHYDSVTNALESIKSYPAKNIGKTTDAVTVAVPAGDTIYTGDKLMVWNSLEGMVPYGVYTVQSGETPAVKYAITATNPENGTYTVQVDGVNAASAEEDDEVTITATPAQGYELDTITVKDADNADVTVTAGKFTMPAKAVTVTVTFKALPTPKAITKAAATNGSFTVKAAGAEVESALADTVITVTPTADQDYKVGTVTVAPTDSSVNLAVPVTKNNDGTYTFTMPDVAVTVTVTFVDDSTPADPAITGTVAVTGDPIVGSKLTATVTGLNDGKTAKYQWQANTGDAGAYENIADATANELTIPATLVGKTIKVVVTADGTAGSIESTPTAAVTVPTHVVTITDPTGGTLSVKNGSADVATGDEVAEGTEITVAATPDADHKGGTITVTGADETPITVTNGKFTMPTQNVTIAVTFAERTVVPFAAGTVTYEEDGDTPLFKDYSRTTPAIEDLSEATSGNTTKVEKIPTTGQSGAGYTIYSAEYPATGDAVKVVFDVKPVVNNAWVSVRGNIPGTANRDNAATGRIFTVGGETSTDHRVKIYNGGDTIAVGDQNTAAWYHIDATVNVTKKTFDVKVYNYSKYNDYEDQTPLADETNVAFRDNTVTGVVAMDFASNTNGAQIQLDNVYINDPDYVAPSTVTVTTPAAADGTLTASKSAYKAGDTITLTATPKAGKKLTAIKVNGETVSTTSPYEYTPAAAADITVTAEFARADVTTVEISGDATVAASAGTKTYTAVAKAGETAVDATFTWSVAAKDGSTKAANTAIDPSTGVLTIDPDQTAGTLIITATTPVDVAEGTTNTETVSGTKEVTITREAVYTLTKGTETNGTFTLDKTEATNAETVTISTTPAAGYQVSAVTYTAEGGEPQNATQVTANSSYTITGLTANVTVNVSFSAIDYTITNSNATADANGNSITIKVGSAAASTDASVTAHVSDTITVVPVAAEGYKIATLKYNDGTDHDILSAKSFTMPAGNVTVTATFEAWDGIYYTQDFSAITEAADFGSWATNTNRVGTKTITDGVLVTGIASDNKRTKDIATLATAVDFSTGASTKISFDVQLNPVGTSSRPTVGELTLANSDNMVLFAIRRSDQETTINTYAGGKLCTNVANGNSIGTTSNNWGSNEYVWNISNASGPAMTVLKTDETTELVGTKDKWYHVELVLTGDAMTAKVYNKEADTLVANATYDITGLKKNLSRFAFFHDQGSSNGSGSNIKLDNVVVQNNVVTP